MAYHVRSSGGMVYTDDLKSSGFGYAGSSPVLTTGNKGEHMSWDQETSRQSVKSFLLDLMDIDVDALIDRELNIRLAEAQLTYKVTVTGFEEDAFNNTEEYTIIKLSDGRVFVQELTETVSGDSWGSDLYTFVQAGKPFVYTRCYHDGSPDEPYITTTTKIAKEVVCG